MTLFDLTVPA